jgi:hypothetical protein
LFEGHVDPDDGNEIFVLIGDFENAVVHGLFLSVVVVRGEEKAG